MNRKDYELANNCRFVQMIDYIEGLIDMRVSSTNAPVRIDRLFEDLLFGMRSADKQIRRSARTKFKYFDRFARFTGLKGNWKNNEAASFLTDFFKGLHLVAMSIPEHPLAEAVELPESYVLSRVIDRVGKDEDVKTRMARAFNISPRSEKFELMWTQISS